MTDRNSAEQFAKAIYLYKNVLAALYGEAPENSRQWDWTEAPKDEKELVIASAKLALHEPKG